MMLRVHDYDLKYTFSPCGIWGLQASARGPGAWWYASNSEVVGSTPGCSTSHGCSIFCNDPWASCSHTCLTTMGACRRDPLVLWPQSQNLETIMCTVLYVKLHVSHLSYNRYINTLSCKLCTACAVTVWLLFKKKFIRIANRETRTISHKAWLYPCWYQAG